MTKKEEKVHPRNNRVHPRPAPKILAMPMIRQELVDLLAARS